MKKLFYLLTVLSFCPVLVNAQATAEWRGFERKGIYNEKNLLKKWPADGPSLLWANENIGNGYGSPIITPERIYITGEIDSTAYLFALDLKGNTIWKSEFGKEWVKTFPGSRSAPTLAGDLIYVCSGLGNIACFDTKKGEKKWMVDNLKDMHGRFTYHGHSESPLLDGENVFLVPGGADTNVVALNRFTGKIKWICKGKSEIPGYNSPILIKLPKRSVLVTFTAYSLLGIDSKTGELLWSHEQVNTPVAERKPGNGDTHSNSVWYENRYIYYIAGDGNCAVKLELSEDGSQIKQIWRNKDIDNYMGGFIKTGNSIYSCTNNRKNLINLDANTGTVTDSLKCGIGTIIQADNHLYYYNQKGEVDLISFVPPKMQIISTFKINKGTKEHFSHPVISNGIFYLRHGKALMAYDIKEK